MKKIFFCVLVFCTNNLHSFEEKSPMMQPLLEVVSEGYDSMDMFTKQMFKSNIEIFIGSLDALEITDDNLFLLPAFIDRFKNRLILLTEHIERMPPKDFSADGCFQYLKGWFNRYLLLEHIDVVAIELENCRDFIFKDCKKLDRQSLDINFGVYCDYAKAVVMETQKHLQEIIEIDVDVDLQRAKKLAIRNDLWESVHKCFVDIGAIIKQNGQYYFYSDFVQES